MLGSSDVTRAHTPATRHTPSTGRGTPPGGAASATPRGRRSRAAPGGAVIRRWMDALEFAHRTDRPNEGEHEPELVVQHRFGRELRNQFTEGRHDGVERPVPLTVGD